MTVTLTFAELLTCTGGTWLGETAPPEYVIGINTDTRTLTAGNLFVPLVGENFDGHDYLAQALAKGAACLLSERETSLPHLRVMDTLVAYQAIARCWREHFVLPVIAITGSAGKTTTKELIAQALPGCTLKTQANENNDVGVARTLLNLEAHHTQAVIEMAMRGPGEIGRLAQTAQPTIAVITNIGTAHIGRLGSQQAIAQAKCELLTQLSPEGVAVLNGEDTLLLNTAAQVWSGRVQTFGFDAETLFHGDTLRFRGLTFRLPLPGRHHGLNFLAALTVAEILGYDLKMLTNLPALELPGGRTRIQILPGNIHLIDETYNAAPEAMLAALTWLASQPGRRWAVLGAMAELGEFALPLHQKVGERVQQLNLDGLFVLGDTPELQTLSQAAYPVPTWTCLTLEDLAQTLTAYLQPHDRVLCKASRSVNLERLFPLLLPYLQK